MKFAVGPFVTVLAVLVSLCSAGSAHRAAADAREVTKEAENVSESTYSKVSEYVGNFFKKSQPHRAPPHHPLSTRTVSRKFPAKFAFWIRQPRNKAILAVSILLLIGFCVGVGFAAKAIYDLLLPYYNNIDDIIPVPEPIKKAERIFDTMSALFTGGVVMVFVTVPMYLVCRMGKHLTSVLSTESWSAKKCGKTMFLSVPVAGALTGLICLGGYFAPMFKYGIDQPEFLEIIEKVGWGCVGMAAFTTVTLVLYYLYRVRQGRDSLPIGFHSFVVAMATHLLTAFVVPAVLCLVGMGPAGVTAVSMFLAVFVVTMIVAKVSKSGDDGPELKFVDYDYDSGDEV